MSPQATFLDALNRLPGVRAGWMGRVAEVDVACDRDEAMRRLRPHHERWLADWGGGDAALWRAEQVHGAGVAVVPGVETVVAADGLACVPGVDGLVTSVPGVVLAVYVADCGPIWLFDPVRRVAGLLHSGKKGTGQDILGAGLAAMCGGFGGDAADVVVVLGPCIRPPDYDVDFAADIAGQAARHGVASYVDCGINTASDMTAHYSYRRELGKTGRMLATIRLDP